ncbi:hypothetical protein D3C72_1960890 [compost metagenome]
MTPAALSNSSMARWSSEPTPVVPTDTSPGCALAWRISAASESMPLLLCTVKPPGSSTRLPIRSKLRQVKVVLRSMGMVSRFGVLIKPMV